MARRNARHDLTPLWGFLLLLAVPLGMSVLGVSYTIKWTSELWSYATAKECPAGAPAADCVITVAGTVDDPRILEGAGSTSDEAIVYISIDREAARSSPGVPGGASIRITPGEADDLGLSGQEDVPVTVTLFQGDAMTISGPTGDTVSQNNPPTVQFAGTFVLTVIVVALAIAGTVHLWRRLRRYGTRHRFPADGAKPSVPLPSWLIPAGICLGGGLVAAVLLGWLSVLVFSDAWLIPVVFGVTVVGSAVLGLCYRGLAGPLRERLWPKRAVPEEGQ